MTEKNGVVKWFNAGKGYGFIMCEGQEYFVHFKEIIKEGYKTLAEHQKVRFNAESCAKGAVAKNVYPISE